MRTFALARRGLVLSALAAVAVSSGTSGCGNGAPGGFGGVDAGDDSTAGGSSGGDGAADAKHEAANDGPSDSGGGGADSGNADASLDSTLSDSAGSPDSSDAALSFDGSDASPDGSSDAPLEAAGPCAVDNAACALEAGAGLCSAGACAACTDPTSDTACSAAYGDSGGTGHLCSAGVCVPGDCRADADCNGKICGLTTPMFCGGCTTDAQCQSDATYGAGTVCDTTAHTCVTSACATAGAACANAGDICCPAAASGGGDGGADASIPAVNACVPGNCCSDTACAGATPACNTVTHTCSACDPLAGNAAFVVVDPVNGRNVPTNGAGTIGGSPDGLCAYKTITYALGHLGVDAGSATVVNVLPTGPVSVAANGESFPIPVPAGVTVAGSGGVATVNVLAGDAFTLATPGSTLANLLIDGARTASRGVHATNGSTLTTSIGAVEVRHFASAGVRVDLSGRLTITAGTNVHTNGGGGTEPCGMHVTGQAEAVVVGGAVPIQFDANAQNGILVDGASWVSIAGTPGTGTGGSVVANANLLDGLEIDQVGATPPQNVVTGLVAAGNALDGMRIYGGSSAKTRGSVFIGNGNNGIDIEPAIAGANLNSLALIDLGTSGAAGGNVLQSSANPNAFAGVCLDINAGASQTLLAEGNVWPAADGGVLTCVSAADAGSPGTLSINANKHCSGGVDIGGTGLSAVVTGTSNGVNVGSCTCGAGVLCQ